MAESTLDSELFVLFDHWPGVPTLFADTLEAESVPMGGFLGPSHHNVVTPMYELGTKFQVYNDATAGKAGYAIFMYLKMGTQDVETVTAAKSILVGDSATDWRIVTDDPDSCVDVDGSPVIAVALSAMTNNYYGWFWVGGVCPETWVAALAGNYKTKDGTIAGQICAANLAADEIGIGPCAADTDCVIGFALAADAG